MWGINIIKKARAGIELLACKYLGLRKPLLVSFEITSKCNSDCRYCSFEGQKKEFDTEEVLSLISEMSDIGTKKLLLTGGEPLLRENIGEIVDAAHKHGMSVNLNSNGFLVPEKIESIDNVDNLVLSLDGPKKIHNYLRGENSFEKVMKAIETAKEHNIDLKLTSVISQENIGEVTWLLYKAKKMKVPINFQPVVGEPYGVSDNNNLSLTYGQLFKAVKRISEFKKMNPDLVRPSFKTLMDMIDIYVYNKKINCGTGNIACRIVGRDLIHCARECNFNQRVSLEKGFERAWNELNENVTCNYQCCTGDIERSNIWRLNISSIANQLINESY